MTAVRSSEELIARLEELSGIQTFNSYELYARRQAARWVEGEHLEWLKSLTISPGAEFHQNFTDQLAAEGTKVLMQHSNPRQASAKWWQYHIEPIHWLMGKLAGWSPGCNQPHLLVK